MQELYAELGAIFRNVFGDDVPDPTPEMVADDVDGWDSLNHVRFIIAVESHFNIRFSTLEITNLKNVGDLVDLISDKHS